MKTVRGTEGGDSEGVGGWRQYGERRVETVRRAVYGDSEGNGGWRQ